MRYAGDMGDKVRRATFSQPVHGRFAVGTGTEWQGSSLQPAVPPIASISTKNKKMEAKLQLNLEGMGEERHSLRGRRDLTLRKKNR